MTVTIPTEGGNDVNDTSNGDIEFKSALGGFQQAGEGDAENFVEGAVVVQNLIVGSNVLTGPNGVCQGRHNGADGNVVATITAGTGDFEDNSNTDTLAAGDTYSWEESQPTGMHGDAINLGDPHASLDAEFPIFGSQTQRDGSGGAGGGSFFWALITSNQAGAESGRDFQYVRGETYDQLRVTSVVHGGSNSPFVFRDDGADGNLTVTITGTGQFVDASNTDTPAADSLCNWEYDTSAENMGDNYFISVYNCVMDRPAAHLGCGFGSVDEATTPRYGEPVTGNNPIGTNTSEPSTNRNIARDAGFQTADLVMVIGAIGGGDTFEIKDRVEGADGNQFISVTATGTFSDESNTTLFDAGDHYAIEFDRTAGSSTTNLVVSDGSMVTFEEQVAVADPAEQWAGTQQPTNIPPALQHPVGVIAYAA